ncbi:hypothetical protein BTN50_0765 [Candidatus Enterovibrio altilux]|uniref:Mobile element protein n=1 Tax=Candidatus Enterovibrio altilux TaxID=1927128 RepID=A0A291B8E3_9GAMM|nr:hypothetical protein BTN50_0765 [Candidatus Enterovibrio luxaltus]
MSLRDYHAQIGETYTIIKVLNKLKGLGDASKENEHPMVNFVAIDYLNSD